MNKFNKFLACVSSIATIAATSMPVLAAEDAAVTASKASSAGWAIAIAAAAGALAMGLTISKSAEGISKQPEASGKIQGVMMLGLVFIETAIIYALIVAILIIFVL